MAVPQVDKLTLKELQELRTRVEKAIVTAQERERSALRAKFESMAHDAGFGISDLFGSRSTKGKTVAAKYMNPDNPSETWTGRGRKPNWLVAKLDKGKKMSDFAI
jgi:DNA-binding protein H-NS